MELMAWTDESLAERFDRIDERFDRVDEKFGDTNRRIDELGDEMRWRLETVSGRMGEQFTEVNRRIDDLTEQLSEVRQGTWSLQRTMVIGNFAIIGALIGVIASILVTG